MSTKQLIKSAWFTPQSMKKIESKAPAMKRLDLVAQGYKPTADASDGVLVTIENYPLAYSDIPTANKQIFQHALWDRLMQSEDLNFRMKESRSFFGESEHRDDLEVKLKDVSHRITEFHHVDPASTDLPLLVGAVDVLDTPMGNIIYSLMKSSYIGISSRGYGSLIDADDHENQIVSADDYVHICWDFVGIPAVKEAMATVASYAKSSRLVEPIVQALIKSSARIPEWGELARIIQADNKKIVMAVPRSIKSSRPIVSGWDYNEDRFGGIEITHDGKDVAYLQPGDDANQLSAELEQCQTDEDVQRVLDQYGVLEEAREPAKEPTQEMIQSFMLRLPVKGIPIVESGADGFYIVLKGEGLKLGPFSSEQQAEALLNAQVNQAAKVQPYEKDSGMEDKFYFEFGDKRYGPYATREEAQHDLEEVTQKGLFDHKEEPMKGAQQKTFSVKSKKNDAIFETGLKSVEDAKAWLKAHSLEDQAIVVDTETKKPITSEDEPLDDTSLSATGGEDLDEGPSADEQADRQEFDQMVLLELADTLADTGDENVDDDSFDFGDLDDTEEKPVEEAKKPVTSSEEGYPKVGDHVVYTGGSGETGVVSGIDKQGSDPDEAGGSMLVVKLDNGKTVRDFATMFVAEAKKPVQSAEGDELPAEDEDENFDDADLYFPEDDLGDVSVDEDAGTITVATTTSEGDSASVELSLEDGYLTEVGADMADVEGEGAGAGTLLPEGPLDLFAETGGDVSAAVDRILDLPNEVGEDSTVIDLSDDVTDGDDLGAPGTEN